MAKKIGAETVTVIRAPKVDRLSTGTVSATEHDIEGCIVLPRSSQEEGKGWVIVEGRTVAAPYDADVTEDDRVRTPDGETFEVDGVPGRYKNRRGQKKACIFYLKRLGT